jgi:type IV pilus assembly protein PilQ
LNAANDTLGRVRLVGVSTRVEGRATAIVIETTEPVAYVTTHPDPLTVLVDLRNVAAAQMPSFETPRHVLSDLRIESAIGDDGAALTRVKLRLAKPGAPTIRSRWNTVVVEFDGRVADAAPQKPSATPAPVASTTTPVASTAKPAAVPATSKPATSPEASKPAAVSAAVGTVTAVDATPGPDGVRIRFSGTGQLKPSSIEHTKGLPARLVIDFPLVLTKAPAVTPVGKGPVDKVRVAINRSQPLLTRAVIDLKYPVGHRVEMSDGMLTIVLDPAPVPAAPAKAAQPAPAAPAGPTPVIVPPPAVATAAPVTSAPAAPKPAAPKSDAPAPAAQQPVAPKSDTPVAVAPQPDTTALAAQRPAVPPVVAGNPTAPSAPVAPQAPPYKPVVDAPPQAGSKFTGHLISFDFQQADLRSVLRSFTEISGLNVIVDQTITGTVDVVLKEVPWDQALEYILKAHKLGYVVESNVVRIAPLAALAEEENARQKLTEAQAMSGQTKVMTRTLSYAKAVDMKTLLEKSALSKRGDVQVDPRTNTLIMTDLPASLEQASQLISTLDRAEPQVEIEARIVQTSRDSARALGVQWGLNGRMASELANASPLAFPAQGSLSGRTGGTQGNSEATVRTQVPTGVNLPVSSPTSAVGVAMGTLNGAFNLDVALSALVHSGNAKLLSQPRVMMQNNVQAEMMQGIQIPIQTVSNNTTTVTFKDAALTLKVKPQITAAGTVILDVFLENSSPDFSRSVNGIPPIDTQRAVSQVLVSDAETVVIGGIMTARATNAKEGVPGLSRLPLLGWLFRRDSVSDEGRELLIFITPKIKR